MRPGEGPGGVRRRSAPAWLLIRAIDAYRRLLSPLLPPSCRFVPTCSAYARTAIERFGAVGGTLLAAARLLRCHPFARGGYDPVPGGEEEEYE